MKRNLGSALNAVRSTQKAQPSATKRVILLDDIQDRAAADTRQLNDEHIASLVESMRAIGLIQPIAIDSESRLLAGGHRRAALHILRETDAKAFEEHFPGGMVPVRVFPFVSTDDPDLALRLEVVENEVRRDYSKTEILAIADRLRDAGYVEVKGRPKKHEKPLKPILASIIGKSKRYVQAILNEGEAENKKGGSRSTFSRWEKRAEQLERWADDPEATEIARTLRNAAKKLRELEQ